MSTIQAAKAGMGFLSAGQRDACCRCAHVTKQYEGQFASPSSTQWKCLEGGFLTSAMAVCQRFRPISINRGVTR
jgi:hypothetical protein